MTGTDDGPDPTRPAGDAHPGVDRGDGGPGVGGAETRVGPWGRRLTSRVAWIVAGLMTVVAGAAIYVHPTGNEGSSSAAAIPAKALLGMSAPANLFAQRVKEVGLGLQARRLFFSGFTANLSLATTACQAGMTPVMSFKVPGNDWSGVAAGRYNSQLDALHAKLVALPCAVFVAIHHEPNQDGSASAFTAMQIHALPILGGSMTDAEVRVGVILNGFFFNSNNQGLSDAQLDTWAGPGVRAVSDFIAADTYQLKLGAEDVGSKVRRMSAWAVRVNAKTPTTPVRGLGLGEWNSQTAAGITDGAKALSEDPLFVFGCVWNTDLATVHVLTGARLTAFKTALANW